MGDTMVANSSLCDMKALPLLCRRLYSLGKIIMKGAVVERGII
jgi:hypothetical protein